MTGRVIPQTRTVMEAGFIPAVGRPSATKKRKGATMPSTGRTSSGAQGRARAGRAVPVRLQVMAA